VAGAPAAASGSALRVLASNPRWFTDGSGKAIYLTGSHTWGNFKDMGESDPPPAFDFGAYLDFLVGHHHNFIRLWSWELPCSPQGQRTGALFRFPFPWPRSGPGLATDGKLRFDLARFDPSYFDRLRARVSAARERGIYVSVMLFDGYGPQFNRTPADGFPYDGANNINGLAAGGTESQSLRLAAVTANQEAYVRQVVDTVNDLDNVLYEVANEAGVYSTAWQYHFIQLVKRYEATKPAQHPVGMTFQYAGGSDALLLDSPADWISPAGPGYGYPTDPPAADGRKVVVNDTDHSLYYVGLQQAGPAAQREWVWKNFLRGNNTLFMDPYLLAWPGRNQPRGDTPDPYWDTLRNAMGDTRRWAERVNLAAMTPHDALSSTAYCLAHPAARGAEYLVYLPTGGPVSVDLSAAAGELAVTWCSAADGRTVRAGAVSGGARRDLRSPFTGDAVLWLVDPARVAP
jgi:hypothetical protein